MAGLPEVWAEPSPERPDCRRPHGQTPQNPPGPHAPPAIARQGGVPPAVAQPSAEQRPCDLLCLFFPVEFSSIPACPPAAEVQARGGHCGPEERGGNFWNRRLFLFSLPIPALHRALLRRDCTRGFQQEKGRFPPFPFTWEFHCAKAIIAAASNNGLPVISISSAYCKSALELWARRCFTWHLIFPKTCGRMSCALR